MPQRTNLPTELLRSLVAVADFGSMSRAAREVHLTQSALSLQMKRLAGLVQAPIFERHHRGLLLTPDGKTLLAYARAILNLNDQATAALIGGPFEGSARIGMIQDFAEGPLSNVLFRFSQLHPGAHLQIRVGNSSELRALLAGGVIDLAVCLAGPLDPDAITRHAMLWLGQHRENYGASLPLVLIEKPCIFRDAALAALDENGVAYRIALETPDVSVLCAAVRAGIGITCRSAAFLNNKLPILGSINLPLPSIGIALHVASNQTNAVERLAVLMRGAIRSLNAPDQLSLSPN